MLELVHKEAAISSVGQFKERIWIVEKDYKSLYVYRHIFSPIFELRFFNSVQPFFRALEDDSSYFELPKAIIADVILGDEHLLERLEIAPPSVRELVRRIPFVALSAVDDILTMRRSYALGANDFVTKPFNKVSLLGKIEHLLDMHDSKSLKEVRAVVDGVEIEGLTKKEKSILRLFLLTDSRIVDRQSILRNVWPGTNVQPKTLDVHIYNLRRKLSEHGYIIEHYKEGNWRLIRQNKDVSKEPKLS